MATESGVGSYSSGAIFLKDLIPHVDALIAGSVRTDLLARDLTTLAVGGKVQAFVPIGTCEELRSVLALLDGEGQRIRVLGNGSNILVGDEGASGWILRLGGECKHIKRTTSGLFSLGAGNALMSTVRKICAEGFSGLEFAGGIPASIGGAVYMNAGAHGAELCERIVSVQGVRFNGEDVEWSSSELPWRYRSSGIPFDVVVTGVTLALTEGDAGLISSRCEEYLKERRARQPLALPSVGSVFKNPTPEMPAGKVLEDAGAKGLKMGGAEVSLLHANWIVNPNKTATAADVLALISRCQELGKGRGFELEPEVRMWDVQHIVQE
jgi:UDP-N-acetylmuramate dehydrogenase